MRLLATITLALGAALLAPKAFAIQADEHCYGTPAKAEAAHDVAEDAHKSWQEQQTLVRAALETLPVEAVVRAIGTPASSEDADGVETLSWTYVAVNEARPYGPLYVRSTETCFKTGTAGRTYLLIIQSDASGRELDRRVITELST